MTPMVSVLLPTIRTDLFRIRMDEMARLELPWPCELIVVSDRSDLDITQTHPQLPVKLFVQPRSGTVAAMNLAFAESQGRYVFATNDECELDPHIFTALVRAGESNGEDGIFAHPGTPYCSNDYYDIFYATYPFGRRSYFQKLNGGEYLFDPIYNCFYADPDLGLRAHTSGYPVKSVPDARSYHHNVRTADGHAHNWHSYYQIDRSTFVTRWAHLGPPPIDPSLR